MLTQRINLFLDSQTGLLATSSVTAYRERLERFAEFVGDQKVSPLLCKQYPAHLLAAGLSRRSVAAFYATVTTMFAWLHEAGVISANPVPKLRRFVIPHTEREAMTQDEVDRLLEQVRKDGRRDWQYAVRCAWETGLRLGDVATLRWCEVNIQELTIKRVPMKTKRFGKVVEIPISDELLAAMKNCPPHAYADPSFVCPLMGQKYSFDGHKTLSAEFIYYARKAGVMKSFHSIRHGFTSRLLNKGISPAIVQSFTGHSLRQLSGYSHVDLQTKRAAVA